MREYDVPEGRARFMVAIERGEIDGDTWVVDDDDEDWHFGPKRSRGRAP